MEQILKTATELGRLVADQPAYHALRSAELAVQADKETTGLLGALHKQRRHIAELEAQMKPVGVEDKHELQRLNEAAGANDKLRELLRAQADFMQIMNRINQAIQKELRAEGPAEGGDSSAG